MKKLLVALTLFAIPASAFAAETVPDWAYPQAPPDAKALPDDGQPKHLPGSTRAYTVTQIEDNFSGPDWYPDEHAPMPALAAHGKPPTVRACASCHLATGRGHPESANLAGLPADYIVEQIQEFRDGNRKSSGPGRSRNMILFSGALTDDNVKQTAAYFSTMKPMVWTKVVEAAMVPKSYVGLHDMRFVSPGNAKEPIGHRIIELPEDRETAEERDPHSSFIAYVPPGSIKAGEKLATTGDNGKTVQCSICHGADYKGVGNVPNLAGHGAIYIYRQLYDMQQGNRKGNAVALMQPVVAKLTQDDMIALAAFMSSRKP